MSDMGERQAENLSVQLPGGKVSVGDEGATVVRAANDGGTIATFVPHKFLKTSPTRDGATATVIARRALNAVAGLRS